MLEITHQQARRFLQTAADQPLGADEKSALDAHLAICTDCSTYASNLTELEARLRSVLHAQMDSQQPALDLHAITYPSSAKFAWKYFVYQTHAMGKITIVVALLLGYFVIANIFGIKLPISERETPTILPTPNALALMNATSPTPSIQSTLTGSTVQACETLAYIVQADDTLESIAVRHGTNKDMILEYNKMYASFLSANTVFTGMELAIPVCKSTPSRTATTTITPLSGTIYPVQPE
jgi:LysM repeat protein